MASTSFPLGWRSQARLERFGSTPLGRARADRSIPAQGSTSPVASRSGTVA